MFESLESVGVRDISEGWKGMPWSNQDLRLYHGTVDAQARSVLGRHQTGSPKRFDHHSDFGRGFYTTSSVLQARKWARLSQSKSRFPGTRPSVVYFVVSRDEVSAFR